MRLFRVTASRTLETSSEPTRQRFQDVPATEGKMELLLLRIWQIQISRSLFSEPMMDMNP